MNAIHPTQSYLLPYSPLVPQPTEDFIKFKESFNENAHPAFEDFLGQLQQNNSIILDDFKDLVQKFVSAYPHGQLIQILNYLLTIYFSDFYEAYKTEMSQDSQFKTGVYQTYLNIRLLLYFLSSSEVENTKRNANINYNSDTAEKALGLLSKKNLLHSHSSYSRKIIKFQETIIQKKKKLIEKLLGFIKLCLLIKDSPSLLTKEIFHLTQTKINYLGCIELQKKLTQCVCFDLNPIHTKEIIPSFIKAWNQGQSDYQAKDQAHALKTYQVVYERFLQFSEGIDLTHMVSKNPHQHQVKVTELLKSFSYLLQICDQFRDLKSNLEKLPLHIQYVRIMGISYILSAQSDLIFYNSVQNIGIRLFSPLQLEACGTLLNLMHSLMNTVFFKGVSLWELFLPASTPPWVSELNQKYFKEPLKNPIERLKSKFDAGLFDSMQSLVKSIKESAQQSFVQFDPHQYLNFHRLFSDHLYVDVNCIYTVFSEKYKQWTQEFTMLAEQHGVSDASRVEIEMSMSDLAYFFDFYFKDVHHILSLIITIPISQQNGSVVSTPTKRKAHQNKKHYGAKNTEPIKVPAEPANPQVQTEIPKPVDTPPKPEIQRKKKASSVLESPQTAKIVASPKTTPVALNTQKLERIDHKLDLTQIKSNLGYRKFVNLLEELGCTFKEHGTRHEHFSSPNGRLITVPRHPEIKKGTAFKIVKSITEK